MGTCRSRCTSSTSEVPWSSMIRRKCATALGSSASLLRSWTNASGGTPGSGTLTAPPEPKSQYIDVGDHSHSLTGRHRIEGQSTKEFLHVRCHLHLPRRGEVRDTAGSGCLADAGRRRQHGSWNRRGLRRGSRLRYVPRGVRKSDG